MRNQLGEEIAVLDGLEGLGSLSIEDGRIGRRPATGAEYANRKLHNYQTRRNVIDASEGANYSGGSSYAAGLPLMPSSVGLAGGFADSDLINYSKITNVLPPRRNVIDPSGGANYSGGSSWGPGIPLVTSGDPGLAAPESYDDFAMLEGRPTARAMIRGGYGSAGLGAGVTWPGDSPSGGGYGRAGLGVMAPDATDYSKTYWEEKYSDFDGYDLGTLDFAFGSTISIEDGRIGRRPATGAEYANRKLHNYQTRRNVIDASEGANYSGGSSYAAGLPLMPSSVGLAGLGVVDGLDGLSDLAFFRKLAPSQKQAFKRIAGKARLKKLQGHARKIAKAYRGMSPMQKARAKARLQAVAQAVAKIRSIRQGVYQTLAARRGMQYATGLRRAA